MKREFKRLTGNRGCYLLYVLIFVSIAGGAMLNAHLVAGVKPSFAANLSFGAILFFVSASLLGLYWQRHKQVTLTKSKLITNTRTAEKIAQYNTIVGQEIAESALYLTTFDDQLEISRATKDYGELITLLCQQSDVFLDNAIQFPWKLALQRDLPARPFQRHSSASVGDPVKALLFTEYHITMTSARDEEQIWPTAELLRVLLHTETLTDRYGAIRHVDHQVHFIFKKQNLVLSEARVRAMEQWPELVVANLLKLYDHNPVLPGAVKLARAQNLVAYADKLQREMRFDEAIQIYQAAMRLTPEVHACALQMGEIFFEKGQFEQAALAYKQGLAIESCNTRGWRQLGYCELKLGNADQAVDALTQAVTLAPDDPENTWAATLAYAHLGNAEKTTKLITQTLALKPDWDQRVRQNPLLQPYLGRGAG